MDQHEVSSITESLTSFESSFSYYAGGRYNVGDVSAVLEYMNYFDVDDVKTSGFVFI